MTKRCFRTRAAVQQRKVLLLDPAAPGSLRTLAALHLEHLRVRHFSEGTVSNRNNLLRVFVEWAEERSVRDGAQVSAVVVERYQRFLYHQYRKDDGQPLSITAQRKRLLALVGLFSWAVKAKHLAANPAADLDLPRDSKLLPRAVFSTADVAAILAQPDLSTTKGLRDRAIMEVLYSTGIRRTELSRLKLYDIERDRGLLLIREGKGRQDRYVPLGAAALAWIDRYLADVRPGLVVEPDEGHVFLNLTGEALGAGGLGYELRQYITAAGITHRGACHQFRHAFATHLLEAGCDIRFIQEMLGHAKLDTTAIYARVTVGALKTMHARFHPSETRTTDAHADPAPSSSASPAGADPLPSAAAVSLSLRASPAPTVAVLIPP